MVSTTVAWDSDRSRQTAGWHYTRTSPHRGPWRGAVCGALRNSSSAKGIWNRLCPVDKNGKREFEPTMYARLEKLGLGHKKENPDLLTEERASERASESMKRANGSRAFCCQPLLVLRLCMAVLLAVTPGGNREILHFGHRSRHHYLETCDRLQCLGRRAPRALSIAIDAFLFALASWKATSLPPRP